MQLIQYTAVSSVSWHVSYHVSCTMSMYLVLCPFILYHVLLYPSCTMHICCTSVLASHLTHLTISSHMIPLPVVDHQVVVFDVDHIRLLRDLGIVGVLSGTLAAAPQQNLLLGVPLRLSEYDAIWLVSNNHAYVYDSKAYHSHITQLNSAKATTTNNFVSISSTSDGPSPLQFKLDIEQVVDKPLSSLYQLYNSLRSQGYWVLPGMRFGGDFVAYPGDPLLFHSHLIVSHSQDIVKQDLVHRGRLATGVKKLWCVLDNENTFSIEWAGFG